MTEQKRGTFIAIEGPDGVGKTTQAKMLRDRLVAGGAEVVLTHEPTDQPAGKLALEALKGSAPPGEIVPLLTADRDRHCSEVIAPAIEAGKIVICDRYELSTHVYQTIDLFLDFYNESNAIAGAVDVEVKAKAIQCTARAAVAFYRANRWINKIHLGTLVPDLYVILSASSDELKKRLENRAELSEQDKAAVINGAAYNFATHNLDLISLKVRSVVSVSAELDPENTANTVFNACSQVL